ncbi:MAG: hypothetical protein GXC94_07270 [Comamonadaceae bacterium]|nr:hypothetical protein [Comamonadaceae bacterium]
MRRLILAGAIALLPLAPAWAAQDAQPANCAREYLGNDSWGGCIAQRPSSQQQLSGQWVDWDTPSWIRALAYCRGGNVDADAAAICGTVTNIASLCEKREAGQPSNMGARMVEVCMRAGYRDPKESGDVRALLQLVWDESAGLKACTVFSDAVKDLNIVKGSASPPGPAGRPGQTPRPRSTPTQPAPSSGSAHPQPAQSGAAPSLYERFKQFNAKRKFDNVVAQVRDARDTLERTGTLDRLRRYKELRERAEDVAEKVETAEKWASTLFGDGLQRPALFLGLGIAQPKLWNCLSIDNDDAMLQCIGSYGPEDIKRDLAYTQAVTELIEDTDTIKCLRSSQKVVDFAKKKFR